MTEGAPEKAHAAGGIPAARRGALRDASRLINIGDILYQLGTLLYRKSLRYTLFTAGIALLGYFSGFAGLPAFSGKQALVLPLAVGGATLLSGVLLRVIPAAIASRQMMVAQANDMNLMEDYRKSEVEIYLASLWERVYRYEHQLSQRLAGQEPDLVAGERAFVELAVKALDTHLSQPREYFELGIDIHHFEDWLDGAHFDPSDTKLLEQYEGDTGLTAVKGLVGIGVLESLRQMPARIVQRVWFSLITRAVALHVAEAVHKLNREHRSDVFNAQVLIWPGEERAPWLERFPGAKEEVLRRRERLMMRVFGPDRASARRLVDRMLVPNLELATRLRMRFDAEYCVGDLQHDIHQDLEDLEVALGGRSGRGSRSFAAHVRRFVAQARRDMAAFDEHLEGAHSDLFEPARAEVLRAVRIAFHIDRNGLRREFQADVTPSGSSRMEAAKRLVELASRDTECYSRRLLSLRQHHELTRIERLSYYRLIDALWPESQDRSLVAGS